ncbi:MAG: hypothetical protein ACPGJI_07395 [Kangiellaceae bacterium]
MCIRLLVRAGQVKSAPLEITEIENMINHWLPQSYDFETPGGNAELKLLKLSLTSLGQENKSKENALYAILFCNFKIKVNRSVIFNTHLNLKITAVPDYSIENQSIGVANTELSSIELINGKDSFIKDVSNLANSVLPTPLKGLFNMAMASSTVILGEDVMSGMTRYLSIYNSGNQQKVIDYHQKDIEKKIIELSQDQDLRYKLNKSNFEEKLFADFGKKIKVEDKKLNFYFV